MTQAGLSAELLDLIAHAIDSLEVVEVLLVLRRAPERAWSVTNVAHELRLATEKAAAALAAHHAAQLLTVERGERGERAYRYAPATASLRDVVDQLAIAYDTRPVTLVKALYDRPPRAVQSFADAFRLRKPDEQGET
jgi:hypothetical protein